MHLTVKINKPNIKNKIELPQKQNPKPLQTLWLEMPYKANPKKTDKKHKHLIKNIDNKNQPKTTNLNELHIRNYYVWITFLISKGQKIDK